ncbi:MAG: hypothetical protein ACE5LU_03030 [Anaerolineae bacterium]
MIQHARPAMNSPAYDTTPDESGWKRGIHPKAGLQPALLRSRGTSSHGGPARRLVFLRHPSTSSGRRIWTPADTPKRPFLRQEWLAAGFDTLQELLSRWHSYRRAWCPIPAGRWRRIFRPCRTTPGDGWDIAAWSSGWGFPRPRLTDG